jgi:hypothetical protein
MELRENIVLFGAVFPEVCSLCCFTLVRTWFLFQIQAISLLAQTTNIAIFFWKQSAKCFPIFIM